jgi:hypothetical protein
MAPAGLSAATVSVSLERTSMPAPQGDNDLMELEERADLGVSSDVMQDEETADSFTPASVARRSYRIVMPLALLALLVAVLLNWWFVPGAGDALPGPATSRSPVPGVDEGPALEKPALAMIPTRVLQYETITVQAIPGYGDRAAEGVFQTLNMSIDQQIPTVVYVRVEAFASSSEAEARVAGMLERYTLDAATLTLGGTPVRKGWTPDKQAYAHAWVRGQYATLVKASFPDWTPEHTFEIIERQGDLVATDVELFQRTGAEGVQAR